jgi:hypothetical protein
MNRLDSAKLEELRPGSARTFRVAEAGLGLIVREDLGVLHEGQRIADLVRVDGRHDPGILLESAASSPLPKNV